MGQVWEGLGRLSLGFHTGLGQVWEGLRAEGRRNCWFSQRFGQVEDRFGQVSRPLGKVVEWTELGGRGQVQGGFGTGLGQVVLGS